MLRNSMVLKSLTTLCVMVLALGLVSSVALAGSHDSPSRETRQQLAEARQATVQYHDFQTACEDGWDQRVSEYVPKMGLHFENAEFLIEDADAFDVSTPTVLLYVQRGNGEMDLVAVEYLALADEIPEDVFSGVGPEAWDPVPGTNEGIWGLHAWVWQGNPDGVFAPFNPSIPEEGAVVDCPA